MNILKIYLLHIISILTLTISLWFFNNSDSSLETSYNEYLIVYSDINKKVYYLDTSSVNVNTYMVVKEIPFDINTSDTDISDVDNKIYHEKHNTNYKFWLVLLIINSIFTFICIIELIYNYKSKLERVIELKVLYDDECYHYKGKVISKFRSGKYDDNSNRRDGIRRYINNQHLEDHKDTIRRNKLNKIKNAK